jgi:hypothetical protein
LARKDLPAAFAPRINVNILLKAATPEALTRPEAVLRQDAQIRLIALMETPL